MLLETLLMSMPPVAHEMEFMPMNKQEEVFKTLIPAACRGDLAAIREIVTPALIVQ